MRSINTSGQTTTPRRRQSDEDVAIIGMACGFPEASHYEQFWQNVISGKNSITEIPIERWDWRNHSTNSKWGGFIDDIDKFDAGFFGISPKEAESMDPQQRLMLELSWACLEDAGIVPTQWFGKSVGVFLGMCNYDYKELEEKIADGIPSHFLTGTANTIAPNRLSYFYNFHGPSIAIDTACSSSLVAIHEAIQALKHGNCQYALVGGINLNCNQERYTPFEKLGMLSPTGQCHAFDEKQMAMFEAKVVESFY